MESEEFVEEETNQKEERIDEESDISWDDEGEEEEGAPSYTNNTSHFSNSEVRF